MNKYQAAIKCLRKEIIVLGRIKNDLQSIVDVGAISQRPRLISTLEDITECREAIELLKKEGK